MMLTKNILFPVFLLLASCIELPLDNHTPDIPKISFFGGEYEEYPVYVVVSTSDSDKDLVAYQIVLNNSSEYYVDSWTAFSSSSYSWIYELSLSEGLWNVEIKVKDELGSITSDSVKISIGRPLAGNWESKLPPEIDGSRNIFFIDKNNGWLIDGSGRKVYRSVDAGNKWDFLFENPIRSLGDLFFLNKDIGWLVGRSILKTNNGGDDWTEQYHIPVGIHTLKEIHFVNENRGWALSSDYLIETSDGGTTWNETNFSGIVTDTEYFKDIFFNTNLSGWILSSTAIYKTVDGGISWQRIPHDIQAYRIYFSGNLNGWAYRGGFNENLKTTDGGYSWSKMDSCYFDVQYADEKGYIWAYGFKKPEIWGADEDSGLHFSPNFGKDWYKANLPKELSFAQFYDETSGWASGVDGLFYTQNASFFHKKNLTKVRYQKMNHTHYRIITF